VGRNPSKKRKALEVDGGESGDEIEEERMATVCSLSSKAALIHR
jgi:hypothetical protein